MEPPQNGTPCQRYPGESDAAWAGLQAYLATGSVAGASRALGVSVRTLWRLSHRWNWKARATAEKTPPPVSPEDLALQLAVAPHTVPPTAAPVAIRPADLEAIRETVRARLCCSASGAADTIERLARGEPVGEVYQNGRPRVPYAVQLASARAMLEYSGLTPPKRVEMTHIQDKSYQLFRDAGMRMSHTERALLVAAMERAAGIVDATAEAEKDQG
jgi:hypothetical protein